MEIEERQSAYLNEKHSLPIGHGGGVRPLATLFIVLFVQLILLILISFIVQDGPVFVTRFIFGLDFRDFYRAAIDWHQHVDPYLRGRLYTPPASILIGQALHWASFEWASRIMLVLNVSLVLGSLRSLARHYKLNQANELLLYGVALAFYPFYFLVQRGNLDGIMLALLVASLVARRPIVRAAMLGASIAMKIYSGLFLLVLLRKRRFKPVLIAVAVSFLLQLPFLHLLPSFVHAVLSRSNLWRLDENISLSVLTNLLTGSEGGSLLFWLLWAGTLIYRLALDDSETDSLSRWPEFLPWVISFPALVYPYSGVIALPLLAKVASDCQSRPPCRAEKLIFLGIGLLGFQAVAWCTNATVLLLTVPALSHVPIQLAFLTHVVCSLGTVLMIAGACGLSKLRAKSLTSAKSAASAR